MWLRADRSLSVPGAGRGASERQLPFQAVERAAELAEELLEPDRGEAQLHRVQIVLVQVELAARKTGRAGGSFARARLRAVRSRGAGRGEASEALALAGAEIEVL